jgi:hypothetical protein
MINVPGIPFIGEVDAGDVYQQLAIPSGQYPSPFCPPGEAQAGAEESGWISSRREFTPACG